MAPNVTASRSDASSSAPSGTLAERHDRDVGLRQKIPREEHADLHGPAEHDPVAILAREDRTRVPELVPVRYERMLASPFAFLRGAAAVMAQDLRRQPTAGVAVQAFDDALASLAMAYADRTQKDDDQLAKSKCNAAKQR
jgi:hypothetical protein